MPTVQPTKKFKEKAKTKNTTHAAMLAVLDEGGNNEDLIAIQEKSDKITLEKMSREMN